MGNALFGSNGDSDTHDLTNLKAVQVSKGQKLKIIHLVRHGHGTHNEVGELNYEDYKLEAHEDASLTQLGLTQCVELSFTGREATSKAEALLVSPMRRTLETAKNSFPHLIEGQTCVIPWIALEECREQTGLHPCDRRRPVSELRVNHPHVDFSQIGSDADPLYYQFDSEREPSESVTKRCSKLLSWLAASEYREVIVVTHSAYLRHLLPLLGQENGNTHFANCELRSFVLVFP